MACSVGACRDWHPRGSAVQLSGGLPCDPPLARADTNPDSNCRPEPLEAIALLLLRMYVAGRKARARRPDVDEQIAQKLRVRGRAAVAVRGANRTSQMGRRAQPWPSTARSGEWPAWFSFWFSGCWRALAKGTAWAGLLSISSSPTSATVIGGSIHGDSRPHNIHIHCSRWIACDDGRLALARGCCDRRSRPHTWPHGRIAGLCDLPAQRKRTTAAIRSFVGRYG